MASIHTPGRNETTDLDLAAALLRIGIDLDPKNPFKRFEVGGQAPRWVFFFQERSRDGKFMTEQLVKVWDDVAWMRDHPEHPWSYLWGQARYRQELLKIVKNATPLVGVDHRGIQGYLSANADDVLQQKFFRRMEDVRRKRGRSRR